jgi:hypothetical protein
MIGHYTTELLLVEFLFTGYTSPLLTSSTYIEIYKLQKFKEKAPFFRAGMNPTDLYTDHLSTL